MVCCIYKIIASRYKVLSNTSSESYTNIGNTEWIAMVIKKTNLLNIKKDVYFIANCLTFSYNIGILGIILEGSTHLWEEPYAPKPILMLTRHKTLPTIIAIEIYYYYFTILYLTIYLSVIIKQ